MENEDKNRVGYGKRRELQTRDGGKTRQLFILAVFLTFAGISFAQDVKEMYPILGRSLDFDPEIGEQMDKVKEILNAIDWQLYKLTEENKQFFEQINFDYKNINKSDLEYYYACTVGDDWYNAGRVDSIAASSFLKSNNPTINYLPQNLHNCDYRTAWIEGVKDYGTGEYVTYYFRVDNPRITEVIIANGYVKSEKTYYENSRVKKLKMYIDDKPFAILNLEDSRHEQTFKFEPIGKKTTIMDGMTEDGMTADDLEKLPKWTMKFEIIEVYKGDKYDDVAISKIFFDGIDLFCFGAGTKILMSDNSLKNIESVREGDRVKSYDLENGKLTDSKVTKLIAVTHSSLLRLKFADNKIVTTSDHPFWIDRNVWAAVNTEKSNGNYLQKTKVESLKVGDKTFIPDKHVFSEIIEIENINERQITYTIELSQNDNFIANGMLVKTEIVK